MKSIVIALPQPQEKIEDQPLPFRAKAALFISKYGMLTLFSLLLICGLAVGAVKTSSEGAAAVGKAEKLLCFLPQTMAAQTPAAVFADSFCASFLFASAVCFFSLTPVGVAVIPALAFFRGYEYGTAAGILCVKFGFSGLAYFISVLLAGAFMASLALVYLSQYCVEFSASMLGAIIGRNARRTLREKWRELVMNSAFSMIIFAFSSLADTILYYLIGRLFELSF